MAVFKHLCSENRLSQVSVPAFLAFARFDLRLMGSKHFLHRGFRICSTYNILHAEFEYLRNIFSLNGFPTNLVFTQIKKFMSKRYNEVTPEHDSRDVVYCSLPYFGHASETMSRELKLLFSKYFATVNLRVLLVNN